eukprot:symbB.v1.2.018744.t1/scaffold1508.1/size114708/3
MAEIDGKAHGESNEPGTDDIDEWQVIDQVLGYLSQYNGNPDGNDAEEAPYTNTIGVDGAGGGMVLQVLPMIDALRRAIAIVQGRPQMVQMAEEERRQLSSKVHSTLHEWRRRSQELEQLQTENKVLKSELARGRQAVDEVLHRQAELQQRVETMRKCVEMKRNLIREEDAMDGES